MAEKAGMANAKLALVVKIMGVGEQSGMGREWNSQQEAEGKIGQKVGRKTERTIVGETIRETIGDTMRKTVRKTMGERVVVAHRGWSGRAPENTLAAFRLVLEDPRIRWVELDVQLSKDGVPVVIHDFTLKRTTGRPGRVRDYTWEELSEMDAGSWYSSDFAGERIPSLAQVFELLGGRVKLNIELKTAIGLYPGLEHAVTGLIRQYGLARDTVISSFDHYAVLRARSAAPEIRGGLIMTGLPTMVREQLTFAGADFLSMDARFLSKAFVNEMINSGVQVMAWTVNESAAIRRALAMHPGLMICSNYPERVFAEIGDAGAQGEIG